MVEKEYMGGSRAKMWTYLILAVVLVVGIVVANFALSNPALARDGVDAFMGLPPWAFPAILAVVGLGIYWVGLKLETDWPEGLGALLIAGGLAWGEIMLGWENFQLGGMVVVPYVIPLVVFLGLMGYSVARSR
ncbi:hypothetical protein [Paraliomyxa miuraensis]|uniref:hypothetical protein n=1 Tax=Paraliomyxa miuraensis TaxID=376150 RepID=UPI00224FB916|nr:hypothetical protein [Paraliomyxa miuraensis]MCX4242673.1 hypothetical protein [Paraliomyxa miuraensis]